MRRVYWADSAACSQLAAAVAIAVAAMQWWQLSAVLLCYWQYHRDTTVNRGDCYSAAKTAAAVSYRGVCATVIVQQQQQ
jgi:hypothetical protein